MQTAICLIYSDYVSGSETEDSEIFEPIGDSLRMLHELCYPSGEYCFNQSPTYQHMESHNTD